MSIIHTIYDEEELTTNDMFYGELRDTSNKPSVISHLDNFLGENKDTFTYDFPLDYDVISAQQKLDVNLQKNLHQNSACTIDRVTNKQHTIIIRNDKIFVPSTLVTSILKWCHENLKYPGADRLHLTLNQHFFWPNVKQDVILWEHLRARTTPGSLFN